MSVVVVVSVATRNMFFQMAQGWYLLLQVTQRLDLGGGVVASTSWIEENKHKSPLYTISSGRTAASNCSAVKYPNLMAVAFNEL